MIDPVQIQANTNGRLHAASRPSLSPLDRGFLYGDAVYEVWRTYDGVVFAFGEHWQRLRRSAVALHLELPLTVAELRGEIKRTAAALKRRVGLGREGELYIRLQVTRGGGPIGLNTRLAGRASFVLLAQPLPRLPRRQLTRGIEVTLATELRRNHPATLNPLWKTGNYLNNLLCLREAIARGADEVLMTNLSGYLTEASTSNVFFVRDGVVVTPRLGDGMLEGITRGAVLGPVARMAGVRAREAAIRPRDLAGFQECFLSLTTRGVQPVRAIDGVRYAVGPRTVTAAVQHAFEAHARAYAAAHPELRVI